MNSFWDAVGLSLLIAGAVTGILGLASLHFSDDPPREGGGTGFVGKVGPLFHVFNPLASIFWHILSDLTKGFERWPESRRAVLATLIGGCMTAAGGIIILL